MRIGPRNIEAVEQKLREYRIPIESKDVGERMDVRLNLTQRHAD